MNTELRPRGSHEPPTELLHGLSLETVAPQYRETINVWESFDDKKRATDSLLGKLCVFEKRLQTLTTVVE